MCESLADFFELLEGIIVRKLSVDGRNVEGNLYNECNVHT